VEEVKNLNSDIAALAEARDELAGRGIGSREDRAEVAAEKAVELQRLEKVKDEKLKEVRDEYMSRIANAKNAAEKERLLTDMQSALEAA